MRIAKNSANFQVDNTYGKSCDFGHFLGILVIHEVSIALEYRSEWDSFLYKIEDLSAPEETTMKERARGERGG